MNLKIRLSHTPEQECYYTHSFTRTTDDNSHIYSSIFLYPNVLTLSIYRLNKGGLQAPEIISFNCTSLTNPNDIFAKVNDNPTLL